MTRIYLVYPDEASGGWEWEAHTNKRDAYRSMRDSEEEGGMSPTLAVMKPKDVAAMADRCDLLVHLLIQAATIIENFVGEEYVTKEVREEVTGHVDHWTKPPLTLLEINH